MKFRKVFLIEPAHDFTVAKNYTDNVSFVTSGDELVEDLQRKVERSLSDFDPKTDAIVPMGRSSTCLIAGLVLSSKFPGTVINIGVFRGDAYLFIPTEV